MKKIKDTKNSFNLDEIEFATPEDASAVLGKMCDIIKKYGYVTVADFYDLINHIVHVPYNTSKFGWDNLSSAHIKDSALGYAIVFPEPKIIANLKANTNKKLVKKYNKLVRDDIPSIIAEKGKAVKYKQIKDHDQLKSLLKDKLYEEVDELINSIDDIYNGGRKEVIEEAADVVQVLFDLLEEFDISEETVMEKRKKKMIEKGSFSDGIYLIEVEEGE